MGLHLCYDLALPAAVREAEAAGLVRRLHAYARTRPFRAVSDVVRLAGRALVDKPRLRGLCYNALEDVAHLSAAWAREELYRRAAGVEDEDDSAAYWNVRVPADVPAAALGFAVAPGDGSEPGAAGQTTGDVRTTPTAPGISPAANDPVSRTAIIPPPRSQACACTAC